MTDDGSTLINLHDMEEAARERLPPMIFGYYASGAHDEITLRENRACYERIALRPRVLTDVSQRDLSTTVLGARVPVPILIAPMAFQRLAHADGELATARAAARGGWGMVLSTLSTTPVEQVRAATSATLWFQLYVFRDREMTRTLVERVESAGCSALVLTVDTPILGRRERDVRNHFHLPADVSIAHTMPGDMQRLPVLEDDSGLAAHAHRMLDPSLTWRDIEWLGSFTRLPILLKGILRADDARLAVEAGAAGIIVSNHGGRQLDTAVATIRALPEIAQAVAGRAEILIDGGVRRGTDIIKAIALGARAVLLGRPVLWGLALEGEKGVTRVMEMLRDELDLAMALCGCRSIEELSADLIATY
ncbi:MAG: alpha-hydroxy-acid oxidizing protein [Anaerolineae bacterium]|nr:alpha-hydroxy-acid oxidizing protein [Gemmatimonadaceae bacterium]